MRGVIGSNNIYSSIEYCIKNCIAIGSCFYRRIPFKEKGYGVTQNLLLQDNQSSMLLEKNGKASSGKRTRHINIRYYFVTNRVNMKEIEIEWCPTKDMVADFMTKPLQGSHFRRLRDLIMGMTKAVKSKSPKKDVSK